MKSLYLDQLKVNILGLKVGNGHDSINSNPGHLVVTLVDDLTTQGSLGCTHQVVCVLELKND